MPAQRFPIRFTDAKRTISAMGIQLDACAVELDGDRLRVDYGWAFRMDTPVSGIRHAERDRRRPRKLGVHGWWGRWVVNGSFDRIVRIELEPPARARMGPIPLKVRELKISIEDPDGFLAALPLTAR